MKWAVIPADVPQVLFTVSTRLVRCNDDDASYVLFASQYPDPLSQKLIRVNTV